MLIIEPTQPQDLKIHLPTDGQLLPVATTSYTGLKCTWVHNSTLRCTETPAKPVAMDEHSFMFHPITLSTISHLNPLIGSFDLFSPSSLCLSASSHLLQTGNWENLKPKAIPAVDYLSLSCISPTSLFWYKLEGDFQVRIDVL